MVSFEEHLELNAIGILEWQDRSVFALGDRRVVDAELLEPNQPLVEASSRVDLESQVIESGAPGINGFAAIPVLLLKLDDGPRLLMQQHDAEPSISDDPVDFGHVKQPSPPSRACLAVTDRKRNVRHPAECWHRASFVSCLDTERAFGR